MGGPRVEFNKNPGYLIIKVVTRAGREYQRWSQD